jgi:prepilin-type N-terminal cleavage/methylation domain-containing protein
MRSCEQNGFTLIELMIVVVVIGILAAIAIPNYISMQNNAREGTVKANMHTVQVCMEDFSIQNDGFYPTASTSTVPDGRTLAGLCPTGNFPNNPFTSLPTVVQFGAGPSAGHPGELGLSPLDVGFYRLMGNGAKGDTLTLVLTTGQ